MSNDPIPRHKSVRNARRGAAVPDLLTSLAFFVAVVWGLAGFGRLIYVGGYSQGQQDAITGKVSWQLVPAADGKSHWVQLETGGKQ